MSFSAIIPQGGLQGWAYLKRTLEVQKNTFVQSGTVKRDLEFFRAEISSVRSAEDLVSNRSLLSVALTAFGLEADLQNKFLIKKVLEEGTLAPSSLANRFSDKRYFELSKAFGFGDYSVPRTALSGFPDEVIEKYTARKFEILVGEKDSDLRQALSFDREIERILKKKSSETAKWLDILGNPPLKTFFDSAFSLPLAFGKLPLDRQIDIYKDKMSSIFGRADITVLEKSEARDQLRTNFLLAKQLSETVSLNGATTALTLLQNGLSLKL